MIEIRWQGRGGQGAFTASKILGAAVISKDDNNFALSFPSFGPERRGAPMQAFTKTDNKPITDRTEIKKCDYIVVLDESLFTSNWLDDLKPNGKILLNSADEEKYKEYPNIIAIDADGLAMEILKRPITNTAMIGALLGASDIVEIDYIKGSIETYLGSRLAPKNVEIVERAYEIVRGKLDE